MAEWDSSTQVHSEWQEYWDDATGKPYYHNPTTGETVWEDPSVDNVADNNNGNDDDSEKDIDDNDPMHWEELEDPDYPGKKLYHNNKTGETVNEKPDCLKGEDDGPKMTRVWFNPKGYKPSETFPTKWRQPKKYPASNTEMLKASQMVWGDPYMSIFRINVWTSNKPQRYKFTTEDIPTVGWMYMYSFFAFKRYCHDTHRFDVVQKREPVRSKLSPLLLLPADDDKNENNGGNKTSDDNANKIPVVTGRRMFNNEDCKMEKDFSFYAYVDPKPGLSRINVHDMEDPDRHKITPRPPIGYWFQRLHFFGYSTLIWNVKENWEPHRFNVTRDPEQVGWYQCYSFFAFDKKAPGLKLISIHQRNDDAGCLRYKISRGGAHSGWEYVDSFYAFDNPIIGTTRFFVQIDRNPERYRVGIDRALPPWTDLFQFYAYFVPYGNEVILNYPNKDAR